MNVTITRDGLRLQGRIDRPKTQKTAPALIIFHGFGGDSGYDENDLYSTLAVRAVHCGITAVRFDFDGAGRSDGKFSDMDVLRELLDAIAILEYVNSLEYVTDIYLLGHSQGGVVAGMLAGLYPDRITKLILLAPAATLKDDALKGTCMGTTYDTAHIPDAVVIDEKHVVGGHYFRIAKNLPIYEFTSQYTGAALLIHGTHDSIVDYHASLRLHKCLKNSRLCLCEFLDHGIEGADQDKVLAEVGNFLIESTIFSSPDIPVL